MFTCHFLFFREIEERQTGVMINRESFTHKSSAMIFTADSQSTVVWGHHKSILSFLSPVVISVKRLDSGWILLWKLILPTVALPSVVGYGFGWLSLNMSKAALGQTKAHLLTYPVSKKIHLREKKSEKRKGQTFCNTLLLHFHWDNNDEKLQDFRFYLYVCQHLMNIS